MTQPDLNPRPLLTPAERAEVAALFGLLKPSGTPMARPRTRQLAIDPTFTLDLIALWEAKVAPLFDSQRQILTPPQANDMTVFQGGYGCGKTFTAVLFALHQGLMQPGATGLIVGASQLALSDVIFAMVRQIFKALDMTEGQDYALRQGNKRILLKNGSLIYCRTRRQPLMHADFAVCDGIEQFSQSQFGQVLAQLTEKPVKLLATMLPAKPTRHNRWHTDVFDTTPHMRHFVVKTAENVYLPPHYVPMLQGALPRSHWPMLLDGKPWPDKGLTLAEPAALVNDEASHDAMLTGDAVFMVTQNRVCAPKTYKSTGIKGRKYW